MEGNSTNLDVSVIRTPVSSLNSLTVQLSRLSPTFAPPAGNSNAERPMIGLFAMTISRRSFAIVGTITTRGVGKVKEK